MSSSPQSEQSAPEQFLEQSPEPSLEQSPEKHLEKYLELIDRLLHCPSGQEPKILDAAPELLDAGLVQTLIQVASRFAHENNPEAAKFLVFVARQLAHQLGFYPQVSPQEQ